DFGVHTFTGVILNMVNATASITATDTVTGTINGSQSPIVVNTGPLLFGATATMISGGTNAGLIFIAGGNTKADGTGSTVSNTWFYDPATSILTPAPALAFARAFHTATALAGGLVVIAGGASGATGFKEFELCTLTGASSCVATGGTL